MNQHNSKGKILISINKEKLKKTPQTGDQIFTQKRPKQLLTRTNPGGFDYKSYLKKIKIYDQLKENDFIIIKNQNTTPLDLIRRWNIQLQEKLNQSQLTTASKNTLKTLLLGKRNALDRELVQAYADAGVIHILAISGLHIGIIMLFLGFVLRPIRLLPKGKWFYILSIILLLWYFALFSGASPSVIRAVTMFSGLAIARYTHRIHSTFHLLIVSFFIAIGNLSPFLYQVGFQMSYLAVLGIIKIHPMLQKNLATPIPLAPKILGNHHRMFSCTDRCRSPEYFLFSSISRFVSPLQLGCTSLFWIVFDRKHGNLISHCI